MAEPINELAMCGCRCDLCKAYAPNVEKCDQRAKLAEMWNKYYNLDPSVMDICSGCRNEPSDVDCPVRKCVLEKELHNCGACGEFPCGTFYKRCGSFPDDRKREFDMDEYNEYILAYDNETRLREYKSKRDELQKVSEETMRFMRGKYALDEVGDGNATLEFRDDGETVLTIRIREDCFDFHIDSGWVSVADLKTLDSVKQMILAKKAPNRIPLPKGQAVLSRCGMRCDLCVHYTGGTISDDLRDELKERLTRVYGGVYREEGCDDIMLCPGGLTKDCGACKELDCAKSKGLTACIECPDFPCGNCGIVTCTINARSISADDVTFAILPYVDSQYGN